MAFYSRVDPSQSNLKNRAPSLTPLAAVYGLVVGAFTLGLGCSASDAPQASDGALITDTEPDDSSPATESPSDSTEATPGGPSETLLPDVPDSPTMPGQGSRPAEPAPCEPQQFEIATPEPAIDYVVTVELQEGDAMGLATAEELFELLGDHLRQPQNRDHLVVYLPLFYEAGDSFTATGPFVDLQARVRVVQTSARPPSRDERQGDPIEVAFAEPQWAQLGDHVFRLRPGASTQSISIRSAEPEDLLCWSPQRSYCDPSLTPEQAAIQIMDGDRTGEGWQAHLLSPDSDCDAGPAVTPVTEALVGHSSGLQVDYCQANAAQMLFSNLQSQLEVPSTECIVPLPEVPPESAFSVDELQLFTTSAAGERGDPLTLSGDGCDGFTVDRALNPTAIALCPSACSGRPQTFQVEVGCNAACQRLSASAEIRSDALDMVIGIDVSGTMSEEADLVQQNLDGFSQIMSELGVDMRIILLANQQVVTAVRDFDRAFSLKVEIQSNDALDVLLETFDDYAPYLRPGVAKHFLVITDDDTEGDVDGPAFVDSLSGLLGSDFVYHSIASPGVEEEACVGVHGDAVVPAVEQLEIAELTQGTQQSICNEDWGPLFSALSESLLEDIPLSCELSLPPAPSGASYATDSVGVQAAVMDDPLVYTIPNGTPASCDSAGGWFFDDPDDPTTLSLCPASCDFLAEARLPAIQVSLDCEISQPIPLPAR